MTEDNPLAKCIHQTLHSLGKVLSGGPDRLLRPSNDKKAHQLASSLADDVRRDWSCLLADHHGKVVPEMRDRTVFDYAVSEVRFPEMTVRITRGRGELQVEVARSGFHGYWEDLTDLLRDTAGQNNLPQLQDGLVVFGEAFKHHWAEVNAKMGGY